MSQNLVPNPSFESLITCPTYMSSACTLFNDVLGNSCNNWHNIGCGSADYFNGCSIGQVGVPYNSSGYQNARTGVAYIGGIYISYYRELAGTFLLDSLQSNVTYYVEFYVNRSRDNEWLADSSDAFGALFTTGEPDTSGSGLGGPLQYSAQINNPNGNYIMDTLNWTKVYGTFTASGGENFITIGNFKDTSVTHGDGYYYIDDVSVTIATAVDNLNQNITASVYPNPFSNKLYFKVSNKTDQQIILYDLTSRPIIQKIFSESTFIETEQLSKGIYLYEIRNQNGIIKTGKVIKE